MLFTQPKGKGGIPTNGKFRYTHKRGTCSIPPGKEKMNIFQGGGRGLFWNNIMSDKGEMVIHHPQSQ